MIREFLFKVLIWMYNKKFEKVEIRYFYQAIKIIALNKTTALLQDVYSAFL